MYLVEDTTGAIILMMLSLFCLGSWPAFFHVVERRGRHPQHTYLDYSIATFLIALLFAITFGQLGPSSDQDFFLQLSQVIRLMYKNDMVLISYDYCQWSQCLLSSRIKNI
jgi:hypothetical protein